MANREKPARDELKNLQEDLGPYYQIPLKPRRSGTHSRENSFQESLRQSSNTPEPKRSGTKRQDPSSRDSTPNRPTKSRTKNHSRDITSDVSTPRRSPKSEPSTNNTPRPDSAKPERHSREMSQRNRSGRASNRNNGNSHGEEVQIWELCKSQVGEIVSGINAENDSLTELVTMDKQVGAMDLEKIPGESLKEMEQLCRTGVKYSEANMAALKNTIEQLKVLRAVVQAKEQADAAAAGPGKRQARNDTAAAASSLYDFDGAGDSPVPSPIGGSSRKYGDRARERERDRDSMPPKADSVEPQGSVGSGVGSGSSSKLKVVFSKGDAVAFKPKPVNGDQISDWILGEVAQVMGEGKSRRYKVLDIEPDDQSKQKEYRSSASSMIMITPESQAGSLKDWESGKVVLALYPNTTTFYKAEVHSMDNDGKVNLKFEGENDSTTLQQVERRFVIEYRA
ncbi:SAGA-associated factor 29 [Fusarium albosuccineum]|uniref:SAGA-associated factor 29 n=1 Tax=Fusarium albosuccineum TaxID=1237068 RepID=A0A8H4LFW1_9HYPO|nr:SAGA-associated factor 29 [Fusarium albosuccineum]